MSDQPTFILAMRPTDAMQPGVASTFGDVLLDFEQKARALGAETLDGGPIVVSEYGSKQVTRAIANQVNNDRARDDEQIGAVRSDFEPRWSCAPIRGSSRYVVAAFEIVDDASPAQRAAMEQLNQIAESYQTEGATVILPTEIDDIDVDLLLAMENARSGDSVDGAPDYAYGTARAALGDSTALSRLEGRRLEHGRTMYDLGNAS